MTARQVASRRGIGTGLKVWSYLAPASAGKAATRLWFTPFPGARRVDRPPPNGARPAAFGPDGAITGYTRGDGPRSALLVHGWSGSSLQMRRMAEALEPAGYRSVVIDLPGHGPHAGRTTNIYEIAAALRSVAAECGPFDLVVAHSLGAMATAVALEETLEARRLVFIAPGVRPDHAVTAFGRLLGLNGRLTGAIAASMEDLFGCRRVGADPATNVLARHTSSDARRPRPG